MNVNVKTVGYYTKQALHPNAPPFYTSQDQFNDKVNSYLDELYDGDCSVTDIKFTSVYDDKAKDIYHTVMIVYKEKEEEE